MKNLSLILNAVLFAGLIVLYVLFFSQKNAVANDITADSLSVEMPQVESGVVFVNMDSIYQKYQMATDLSAALEQKVATSDAQLTSKGRTLQKDMEDFQYKVDRQLMTRAEAEQQQQELMARQQAIYGEQQQLQYQLAEQQQVMQNQVLNSIMDYLSSIKAESDFNYVLGTQFGGNVLYSDKELDATRQVLNGLNANYREAMEAN